MKKLNAILLISTIVIYALTVIAVVHHGWNWPAVAMHDLMALNWRTQFDFDFIIYLLIFAWWVVWREGGNLRAYGLGVLSVFLGGMFGFPYLIHAIYKASGRPRDVLLGAHA